MPDYPAELPSRPDRPGTGYQLRKDLYAVIGTPDDRYPNAIEVVADDAKTAFVVYRGSPSQKASIPVYATIGDGPLAVPTGRVFIRLASGRTPADSQARIKAAGFHIDQLLSYAPSAAWLRPVDGGVAYSLSAAALEALRGIPGVESVEPQLLLARAHKR